MAIQSNFKMSSFVALLLPLIALLVCSMTFFESASASPVPLDDLRVKRSCYGCHDISCFRSCTNDEERKKRDTYTYTNEWESESSNRKKRDEDDFEARKRRMKRHYRGSNKRFQVFGPFRIGSGPGDRKKRDEMDARAKRTIKTYVHTQDWSSESDARKKRSNAQLSAPQWRVDSGPTRPKRDYVPGTGPNVWKIGPFEIDWGTR